jgi:endonuclease/exonuclease/phosphatase family metal-dependent hydrolase
MAAGEPEDVDLGVLRIMTFNVNFEFGWVLGYSMHEALSEREHELGRRVIAAILDGNADVVFLQETNAGWQQYMGEHLRQRYPVQEWISPDDRGFVAAGSAVLVDPSRFSLLRFEEIPTAGNVEGCFFNQMAVTLQAVSAATAQPAKILNVVNVHLRPPLGMGREGNGFMANVRAYFHLSPEIHRQEIRACQQFVAAQLPAADAVIYLGDFNESASSGGVRLLLDEHDFQDAARSRTTWQWPLMGPLKLWGSYDHIMYRPNELEMLACHVLAHHADASDHLPVLACFRFLTG